MLRLVEPGSQYKESFLQGVREFQREGAMRQYSVSRLNADFESFLHRLYLRQHSKTLPPNIVPSLYFWLIDDDGVQGTYVGTLRISPTLDDFLRRVGGHIGYQVRPALRCKGYGRQLLALGLQRARELGLTRVLVTCDEDNIGSKKVIEYNGGQLENAIHVEGSTTRKLRYWIDLSVADTSNGILVEHGRRAKG